MSLIKNNNNGTHFGKRKGLNLTAQVNDAIISHNNKTGWKSRTNNLIKTLINQGIDSKSNIMTEDDINRLFDGEKIGQKTLAITKVSTEVTETWAVPAYRNFINLVKFLQIEDWYDKFLTGIPNDLKEQDEIDKLFKKDQKQKDLTSEFKKNYLVGKVIGEGAYASVRIGVFKPLERKIAIKVYEKIKIEDPQRKKSVIREIKILQLLKHPNIVKMIDVVETNNHLNIVMEYLPGVSLGSYLKIQPHGKICEKNCKKIFKSLTKALAYMHSLNIAHRDVKLENVILNEQINPKIIDFGFSTCIQTGKKIKIFCGTPSYMAPQIVQRKEYRGQCADIWALGVMLFVCLTGIFPFKGSTDQELYKKINMSDYPKQLVFSRIVSDLMLKMLKIDPNQRITANQVFTYFIQILKHPWLLENRNDSNKKHNTQSSLEHHRKRINTLNSNVSKDNKWAHKTGVIRKALIETVGCENLQLELKNALRSPKVKQQISSYRTNDKQNGIKFLKSEKNTYRAKQVHDKVDVDKNEKKNKVNKTHDILKVQMKKRQAKSKKR